MATDNLEEELELDYEYTDDENEFSSDLPTCDIYFRPESSNDTTTSNHLHQTDDQKVGKKLNRHPQEKKIATSLQRRKRWNSPFCISGSLIKERIRAHDVVFHHNRSFKEKPNKSLITTKLVKVSENLLDVTLVVNNDISIIEEEVE